MLLLLLLLLLLGEDYFEVMTSGRPKVKVNFIHFTLLPHLPPIIFFGVGSDRINQDPSVTVID